VGTDRRGKTERLGALIHDASIKRGTFAERVQGFGLILANQPGPESWPMTAATFILIHKQPPDPVAAAEALKFFAWAFEKGDKMAEELDYVLMPNKVVTEIERMWAREIKDSSDKPLYGASAKAQ
jgi:phosphate transport system substrate-binding protein